MVNRNVIGDTGIHAVTNEIERLKNRLDERSNEFENLRHTQLKDADENNALRVRATFFLLFSSLFYPVVHYPVVPCSGLTCSFVFCCVGVS